MSDQVSQEFNTQVSLPSGTGITSINGDGTPAQLIVASTGIVVGNAGNTHSIGNTGVLSVAKDGSPPRTGAIVLKPSASVAINEGPNGTYEFDAIGAAGIVSINGDLTAAQVIAAGAGISVTPGPPGTNTIAVIGGAGVISINADATAAQTLSGVQGSIVIDLGAGAHTIEGPTHNTQSAASAGLFVPANAITILAQFVVAKTGLYSYSFTAGLNGIAGMLVDYFILINGLVQVASGSSGYPEFAGQTTGQTGAGVFHLTIGDTFAIGLNHHGAGAATTSIDAIVQIFQIGS